MGISRRFKFWLYFRHLVSMIRYHLGWEHICHYALVDIVTNAEPKDIGLPIVAWVHRCWCGREIVEITISGAEQLARGVPYDAVIGAGRYASNRCAEGRDERLQRKETGMADETAVRGEQD